MQIMHINIATTTVEHIQIFTQFVLFSSNSLFKSIADDWGLLEATGALDALCAESLVEFFAEFVDDFLDGVPEFFAEEDFFEDAAAPEVFAEVVEFFAEEVEPDFFAEDEVLDFLAEDEVLDFLAEDEVAALAEDAVEFFAEVVELDFFAEEELDFFADEVVLDFFADEVVLDFFAEEELDFFADEEVLDFFADEEVLDFFADEEVLDFFAEEEVLDFFAEEEVLDFFDEPEECVSLWFSLLSEHISHLFCSEFNLYPVSQVSHLPCSGHLIQCSIEVHFPSSATIIPRFKINNMKIILFPLKRPGIFF